MCTCNILLTPRREHPHESAHVSKYVFIEGCDGNVYACTGCVCVRVYTYVYVYV